MADRITYRAELRGGHVHIGFWVNGGKAGTLIFRDSEKDAMVRLAECCDDGSGIGTALGGAVHRTALGSDGYPQDWPRCPGCGRAALDGHITCGELRCDERGRRALR